VTAVSGRGEDYTTAPVSGAGSDTAGPWILQGQDPAWHAVDTGNSLGLTLTGVSALTVNAAGALLQTAHPIALDVVSDTAVTLLLTGCGSVSLPAGTTLRSIDCGPAVTVPEETGPLVLPVGAAAIGVAALVRRRRGRAPRG
jgi:hypothetical protein